MVVAVGAGDRIAMLLPELGAMFRRPLMTIEKVRLCKRDGQFVSRPDDRPGLAGARAGMTAQFKLTVYTSEAARHDGQPVHRAIVRSLNSAGISGATTVRGIWGYHGDHAPHGDHFPRQARHVPVVTTVIAAAEQVSAAFDAIDPQTAERPSDGGSRAGSAADGRRHSPPYRRPNNGRPQGGCDILKATCANFSTKEVRYRAGRRTRSAAGRAARLRGRSRHAG